MTLTGGLTFGGGPGNNSTSHGIARAIGGAAERTEQSAALVGGLGWYATKHSLGVYASRPPAHGDALPFAWQSVPPVVDALPVATSIPAPAAPSASRRTP